MKTNLYKYQDDTAKDIYNRIISNEIKGAYLGFETGTGKTVTSISVGERLYKKNYIENIVVICPVSKVDDWKRDLAEEIPEVKTTFVSSFQSAWREKNAKQIEGILKDAKSLLIVDEGHKMKTYDSKQSKFIQNIVKLHEPYVLVLSATSQNKKYIDLYPQYKVLGSRVFNLPAKDFKKTYCIESLNYNLVYAGKSRFPFNEIIGYKQADVMDKEILNYTYYKKYESEYDRPIEITETFKMTPEMKYFKEKKVWPKMDEKVLEAKLLAGEDISELDTDFIIANRPTLHHIYMRESCSGFIRDMILDKNPKLQWVEDFLEGNEGRIVIFTNFINETHLLRDLCVKKKRSWVIYDGTTKDLTEWHSKEDCVAIVNSQAGSAGLNDFVLTNIAIYFSLPENYIDFTQSKGRIDRIGQTKQPVYYYLEIAGSVEPAIHRSLKEGKDFDTHLFESWLEEGGV
jgi:SNF2 family DNA or RNA helicase